MLTTIVVFSSVALSQPTADSISVASATGENGQTMIPIPVNITNVADGPLQVIMFDVNYDHGVIDIIGVTTGDVLPSTQFSQWTASFGSNHESITLSTTSQSTALPNGSTGTIAVLWVDVAGTAGQQTDMNLTSIDISSTGNVHGMIPSINGTFMVTGEIATTGDIVINEFASDNATEWVELYNNDTVPVNITGWTLEDGGSHVKSLSGIISADDYLVFGPYSNWLNNPGDVIYLNNTTANIDKVAYGNWDDGDTTDNALAPGKNKSAGRFPNGVDTDNDSADFRVFDNPTQGAANAVITAADTTPPYTSGHVPASGATDVPIDTSITVHVLDDGIGVNNSTIVMTVNGTVVTPDDITGTSVDYTIVYTPSEDFGYEQLVNVTIDAADLNDTPNVMTTDEYSFTTESATLVDTTPPYTSGHVPASGATDVPIDTSITVHVLDDGIGVNNSTIVMTVNGTVVTPDDITGTSVDYTIVYTPSEDFGYEQLVNVTIDAADLNDTPNVMTTDEYSFTTESTPTTYPTADSISVASATDENSQTMIPIPVNITNVANGPLQVIMFDVNYDHGVIDIIGVTTGDVLPSTQFSQWTANFGSNHESITLSIADQAAALQNGSTGTIAVLYVNVTGTAGQQTDMNLTNIDVSSTGLVHGTIPSINGTFTVTGAPGVADTTPPYTSGHVPASGSTGVPIDTSITVHVLDDGIGVNNSTIVMTVNGTVVTPDDITGTSVDYTIVYTPSEDFGYEQLVNVTIDAADLNDTPNVMTTDAYSFTTGSAPIHTSFVIVDPANGTVGTVGTPITVTVEVHDQYGDRVDTYQNNVTLVASGRATGDGLVNIVNGTGSLDISDTVAETVTLSLNDTEETGLYVSSTRYVRFVARDNGDNGGSSSGGTYPPGWGEPASTPAATPAPTDAAPEPTVAPAAEAPTVAPTEAPTRAPTAEATETATTKLPTKGTPGFGAMLTVFAIAGLLVAAYLVMRRRE